RFEVIAIESRRHVVPARFELLAHIQLRLVVSRTERNMMHRSGTHHAGPQSGNDSEINNRARSAVVRRIPEDASLFTCETESERRREQIGRVLLTVLPQRDSVNATDPVLRWNLHIGVRIRGSLALLDALMRYQFEHQSIR